MLEIHPYDASDRGIADGDLVAITSRVGETSLRARVSERMQPGVVYTTFHHPLTGANVITTENSDWATNCPEYKVTAVEVRKAPGHRPGSRSTAVSTASSCITRTSTETGRGAPGRRLLPAAAVPCASAAFTEQRC